MLGTIYLGGGGSPEDELPVWADMLQEANRVLYWPFALHGEMVEGADSWLRGSLAERWPSVQVSTWTKLDGHAPEELAEFDMLFVGGGNTFDLLEHVVSNGFMSPVRQFVATGGSYYGGSAGAILAGDSIGIAEAHDQNETRLENFEGLRLIMGSTILPHYAPHEEGTGRIWSRKQGMTVLGIPERSGLKIKDGQARVLGREPVYVIRATETTVTHPDELLPAV
jgi:dipeptidase E